MLGAGNCSPQNQPVQALLVAGRARCRKDIAACVERAVAQGALIPSPMTETLPIWNYCSTIMLRPGNGRRAHVHPLERTV